MRKSALKETQQCLRKSIAAAKLQADTGSLPVGWADAGAPSECAKTDSEERTVSPRTGGSGSKADRKERGAGTSADMNRVWLADYDCAGDGQDMLEYRKGEAIMVQEGEDMNGEWWCQCECAMW